MKKLFSAILSIGIVLSSAVSVYAIVPGNGFYAPDSTEPYEAGRTNTQSGESVISQEFAEIIAEKEAALVAAESMSAASAASAASAVAAEASGVSLNNTFQFPQEKSYYCGPAAVKSVLYNEGGPTGSLNYSITQSTLASSSYLKTDANNNTPWYMNNGSTFSDYPVYNTLHALTSFNYIPYPAGQLGTAPTAANLKSRVVSTTSLGHAVVADGLSAASSTATSHMPGYTTSESVVHWVAVNGYMDDGDTIRIVDPINGCTAISWNANVSKYYTVSLSKFTAFVATKGIFY